MISTVNLSPKQRIYLTAAFWLAVLALAVFTLVAPLISQIKNDGLELAQKKQEMEIFSGAWQALGEVKNEYKNMQNELYALPALLDGSEALKFIVLMEKFAQATDNRQEVSVVAPAAGEKTPAAKKTTDFQVNLSGNFPNLIKFLIYLENAPYYNNLVSLQTQRLPEKDGAGNGEINTVLKISVYQ
ncbi:MAG: hypothetical protein PHT44_01400 [Candidatus Portnoybacteria bacterium]|nr:hypothetical protein [Candidatus Portnoybacteria bacterium]MDD4982748.1 hypothetical protein [Candidatus Portnoybacteria bacterium]